MNERETLANHILSCLSPQGLRGLQTTLRADRFVVNDRGVAFRFRGSDRANVVRIDLSGNDEFDVAFSKIDGIHLSQVHTARNIAASNLRQCFERETGLVTTTEAGSHR